MSSAATFAQLSIWMQVASRLHLKSSSGLSVDSSAVTAGEAPVNASAGAPRCALSATSPDSRSARRGPTSEDVSLPGNSRGTKWVSWPAATDNSGREYSVLAIQFQLMPEGQLSRPWTGFSEAKRTSGILWSSFSVSIPRFPELRTGVSNRSRWTMVADAVASADGHATKPPHTNVIGTGDKLSLAGRLTGGAKTKMDL